MSTITRSRLEALGSQVGWPRVSIYLPTHRAGRESAQDPILFRNLVTEARRHLEDGGAPSATIARVVAPAEDLLGDPTFWASQDVGLAALLADGSVELIRLPFATRPLVVVGPRFHLKPLLPMLDRVARFHVLAISHRTVRLYEGDPDAIVEVELGDVPRDLRDAVGWDWRPRSLQLHTGTARGPAGRSAVFHGQGAPEERHKAELTEFLREVDAGISRRLNGSHAPLLLAGVGYVTAIYRSLTRHPDVLEETIEGNPDELTAGQVHERALRVLADRAARGIRSAEARYRESLGGRLASADLETILPAAFEGRVATLLVDLGADRWGAWDETAWQPRLDAERRDGDVDLVDLAAIVALRTGADVHALPAAGDPLRIPDGAAAVLRY